MPTANTNPEITILIVANNEVRSIGACLQSIAAQDYPMERVEVLIIDDRSTDGTAQAARDAAASLELEPLRILSISDRPAQLSARQTALDLGLREARGEIVLLATASGHLPREWVRELSGHLSFRDGAAVGPVLLGGHSRLIAGFESLDALLRFNITRWGDRHGQAWGLSSGNLALRREAYLATGGFPAIGFTLNEDQALGEALRRSGFSVRFLTTPAVQNVAAFSAVEMLRRWRRRAAFGATTLLVGTLLLILSNWLLVALALACGWNWLLLLLVRYAVGVLVISFATQKYGSLNLIHWIWLYEPLWTLAMTGIYLSLLVSPHWRWRGVTYSRKGPLPAQAEEPAAPAAP